MTKHIRVSAIIAPVCGAELASRGLREAAGWRRRGLPFPWSDDRKGKCSRCSAAMCAITLVLMPECVKAGQAAAGEPARPTAAMKRLMFMVGRFRQTATVYPEHGQPHDSGVQATIVGTLLQGGRQIRSIQTERAVETASAVDYYDPDTHEYCEWTITETSDAPLQERGGFRGDRLVRLQSPTTWTGLGLLATPASSGGQVVQLLGEHGPARRSGIRVGDVIISIDGHSLRGLTSEQTAARMLAANTHVGPVRVTVERKGRSMPFVVKSGRFPGDSLREIYAPLPGGGYRQTEQSRAGGAWHTVIVTDYRPEQ